MRKKRLLIPLLTVGMLVFSITLPTYAATSVEWTGNAAQQSLVNIISETEFECIASRTQQTQVFSYDASITAPRTDISTTDISFKITISDPGEEHGDFYATVGTRMASPQDGIWGPANSGICIHFYKGRAELRRWSNGGFDEGNAQTIEQDFVDGQPHDVSININDKTVTATIDGQSMTATYSVIPAAGGYQVMAFNSRIRISEFDDGTVPNESEPEPEPEPQPEPEPEPEPEVKHEQEPEIKSDEGEGILSGNVLYIGIAVIVVLLCAGGGTAYYFLVYKKKK